MREDAGAWPSPGKRSRSVGLALAFLLALMASVQVAGQLPPDAQKAYDRGLIAASEEAWELAISSFSEAQMLAEKDPRILYSLGLAHAHAEHNLAGAAWLRAYLAAVPKAENADAVRSETARLELADQENQKKIFAASHAAANQIPWLDLRWKRLSELANTEAASGFIEDALAAEPEINALAKTIPNPRPIRPAWSGLRSSHRRRSSRGSGNRILIIWPTCTIWTRERRPMSTSPAIGAETLEPRSRLGTRWRISIAGIRCWSRTKARSCSTRPTRWSTSSRRQSIAWTSC